MRAPPRLADFEHSIFGLSDSVGVPVVFTNYHRIPCSMLPLHLTSGAARFQEERKTDHSFDFEKASAGAKRKGGEG